MELTLLKTLEAILEDYHRGAKIGLRFTQLKNNSIKVRSRKGDMAMEVFLVNLTKVHHLEQGQTIGANNNFVTDQ